MLNHDKEMKKKDNKTAPQEGKKEESVSLEKNGAGEQIKNDEGHTNQEPLTKEGSQGTGQSLEERLQAAQAENAEMKDKYLRKYAEFENFKKRMMREREESIKYANSMLLLDITAVIDDFERALKSAEESQDFKTFHKGVVMIEKQLVSVLEKKWGLERFSAKDVPYDPERHEAIMSEQTPLVDTPTVLEDFQSGYTLFGRVLRPAKVKVGQPLTQGDTAATNGDNS